MCTTFLLVREVNVSHPSHVLECVVEGKEGHTPCKILALTYPLQDQYFVELTTMTHGEPGSTKIFIWVFTVLVFLSAG